MVQAIRFPNVPAPWMLLRAAVASALVAALAACQSNAPPPSLETAYVGGAAVELRSELGPTTHVTGTLQSGERVEVISKRPRWAEVRRASGEVGWVQQRLLVDQQLFDRFEVLYHETEELPSQGGALVLRDANLHTEPGRDTPVFYQLAADEQVEVVEHDIAERTVAGGTEEKIYEDWLLVRGSRRRAGWVLESSVELNPPMEVARYREGQRIRAWFVIHSEQDQGQERAWYLWATGRRQTGLAHDFDEIRVFVWNPRASRYETSYRERGLTGHYPIHVETRQTPEGPSPAFRLQAEDANGQRVEKRYVMAGRMVRSEK